MPRFGQLQVFAVASVIEREPARVRGPVEVRLVVALDEIGAVLARPQDDAYRDSAITYRLPRMGRFHRVLGADERRSACRRGSRAEAMARPA
jgi:hypothetical protein